MDNAAKVILGGMGLVAAAVGVVLVVSWFVNLYRFTQCDFEAPYKCELLHGIGIVPVIAPFVVWADTDD